MVDVLSRMLARPDGTRPKPASSGGWAAERPAEEAVEATERAYAAAARARAAANAVMSAQAMLLAFSER